MPIVLTSSKAVDLIFDSYVNEFVLGKKRILVPMSAAKIQMQNDGVIAPVFDSSDTVYYQMPGDETSDLKLTEVDMSIRSQEHEQGIQRSLDILSLKTGLGTGRYQFDSSGVKTATEVISDKSDLYQNRQKNAIVINTALVDMVSAISFWIQEVILMPLSILMTRLLKILTRRLTRTLSLCSRDYGQK